MNDYTAFILARGDSNAWHHLLDDDIDIFDVLSICR